MAQELADRKGLNVWTVSLLEGARLHAAGLHYAEGGLAFDAVEGAQRVPVRTALVGDYNASNALGVLAGLRALGVPLADAVGALAALTPVPGRLQRVAGREVDVIVDYAHTPDALHKVLQALRPLAAARGGQLWCVFGCGGNRDASKRPLMGASKPPLQDWMPPPAWGLGAHAKHLRNLYVYFWRWATWKVFDHPPKSGNGHTGIVAFITVAGFLSGPGFERMREYLRNRCDEVWVIDCSPEGDRKSVV